MNPAIRDLRVMLPVAAICIVLRCSAGDAPDARQDVPDPDLSGMELQVVRLLQQAREEVLGRPDSAEAWGELGSLYDAHMLGDMAEGCYVRAQELDPADFRWVYLHAVVREIQGADEKELSALFERAAEIRPDYVPLYVRLGDGLARRGRYSEARESLERALELAPQTAMAQRRLGQVLLALGDAQAAAKHLARAVTLEPRDLTAYSGLAQALMRMGQTERAHAVRERARGLEPVIALDDSVYGTQVFMRNMSSGRAFARATAALRAGAPELAVEDLKRVLQVRPDDASAHYWTGTAQRQLGRPSPAETHLSRAVELDPGLVAARLQLAGLLVEQQRFTEATEQYEHAASLKPLDADGHYGLGLAYDGLGRPARAREQYREALALDPDHAAASRLSGS